MSDLEKNTVVEEVSNEAETTTEVETDIEQPVKRGRGRPRKDEQYKNTVTRATRTPLGGFRNILTVENKDPNYHYAWPVDTSDRGQEIAKCLSAGYDFVRPEEKAVIGESSVFKTDNVGSIIRVPAGQGEFHYLMKIPNEFYEDDQLRSQEKVDRTEEALVGNDRKGFYGPGLTIENK